MQSLRRGAIPLALTVLALVAVAAGCSSKSSTGANNPPVTGPTWSFTFPQTGTSNQLVFTDVGTWNYHCIAHGSLGMTGTVIVDPAGPVDSAVVQVGPGNALSFSPATVTIKPGPTHYVRWVNVSSFTNHTSTRP